MEAPLITMITHAGFAARFVLIILLAFSIVTWAIIFNRMIYMSAAKGGNRRFRKQFDSAERLSDLEKMGKGSFAGPLGKLAKAGIFEYRRIMGDVDMLSGRDSTFLLQSQFSMAAEHIESSFIGIIPSFDRGVFLLAMVSSLSPFLGLLGTVWGIMNSFFEIGSQGSASLPVVAPGIAEALVATLAGLAVAIPALFFYNFFNHSAERIETELDEFKALLLVRIKREVLSDLYSGNRGSV